ncbi:uncharacterized protein MELLADRAFT_117744 [Melampsora larici-populina 98AG31]|uniref:ABC1 atypical kinase-like domain-containing protein n=1 Tax=Melampsora larici-populina (strain 98AG31 / pathotype 3-4-7) TaxID=747676 RepID=F4S119_MELLP|nr:uncharacterized protein MELLADRAFT_117744 [Melampsora larici-populina 98AG31]EGG01716.1 hypothetical protein MELLADRAFT_117744 [Melampsora larici-populina 98AG31]
MNRYFTDRPKTLRSSRVPSSRLGRLFHYGGLAAGLSWGTASEALRRTSGMGSSCGDSQNSLLLSEANVRRLVDKLTKMRGAALKLGQFMSIQDAKILPPQIEEIFVKVQNTADYMPLWQTEQVMKQELGTDWRHRFLKFSDKPLAAASIGQVHSAQAIDPITKQPIELAIKVQFPGVFESIHSDLSYLSILASSSAILPKGLFLSNTLKVLGQELKDECDYRREAWCMGMMSRFLEDDSRFKVPRVIDQLSTGMVLSMEMMRGTPLTRAAQWPQHLRDQIGRDILQLCLREIFQFRLMQTDPNWTNFLWNEESKQIELIDFGATREYSERFVEEYIKLLQSGVNDNREDCVVWSEKIGYFTGHESKEMQDAHFRSLSALGEPFRAKAGPYDFATQTVTDRVRAEVPLMIRERLTPPPIETYSLNRKLSGAFLLCSRLGSQIDCHQLLQTVLQDREKWKGPTGLRQQRSLGVGC